MSIYLVQADPRRDYTPALLFGRIAGFIFSNGVFPDNADERVVEMKTIARKVLLNFNPEEDYLLLNGDPVSVMVATNVLTDLYGTYKTLKWDNQLFRYYEVRYPNQA